MTQRKSKQKLRKGEQVAWTVAPNGKAWMNWAKDTKAEVQEDIVRHSARYKPVKIIVRLA